MILIGSRSLTQTINAIARTFGIQHTSYEGGAGKYLVYLYWHPSRFILFILFDFVLIYYISFFFLFILTRSVGVTAQNTSNIANRIMGHRTAAMRQVQSLFFLIIYLILLFNFTFFFFFFLLVLLGRILIVSSGCCIILQGQLASIGRGPLQLLHCLWWIFQVNKITLHNIT